MDMPGQVTSPDDLQQGQTGYRVLAGDTELGGQFQGIPG
jgi:hypothetical protein